MSLFADFQLILFAKLQEASIISLYLLVIIYSVICLASPNVSLQVLPTHFICKGPGSFHCLLYLLVQYCLHCNLSCFTQCVSLSFTNSFYFQRSREFPFFHVIYVVCKMQNCFKFPQRKLTHVRHTLA